MEGEGRSRWKPGVQEIEGMGRKKWDGGKNKLKIKGWKKLKRVMGTRHDKTRRAFPGQGYSLTGIWPDALGARCVRDQVRAAKTHELGTAPQRLPKSSGLFAEAPLALTEARQAQQPERLLLGHGTAQGAKEPGSHFPRAEVDLRGVTKRRLHLEGGPQSAPDKFPGHPLGVRRGQSRG